MKKILGISKFESKNVRIADQIKLKLVKVSRSQNQFLLKLHCPKNERNMRQNSDLYALIALDQFFMGKSKTPPWLSKNSRLWYLFNLFSVI